MKNNKPTPPKKVTKRVINTKPVEDAATKKARVDGKCNDLLLVLKL